MIIDQGARACGVMCAINCSLLHHRHCVWLHVIGRHLEAVGIYIYKDGEVVGREAVYVLTIVKFVLVVRSGLEALWV